MKLFIDRDVLELESKLRLECIELMDKSKYFTVDKEEKTKLDEKLKDTLKQWHDVYDIISGQRSAISDALLDVGTTVVKVGLSLGANVVLAIVVGRLEFVDGKLIPTWAKVNVPIAGPKL